jgi:hypothetical protein
MYRLTIAAALAAAIALPAFAQSTEFYVVQDVKTKKCTIVDKKPSTAEVTAADGKVYKTRIEAENVMKTIKVCESK